MLEAEHLCIGLVIYAAVRNMRSRLIELPDYALRTPVQPSMSSRQFITTFKMYAKYNQFTY